MAWLRRAALLVSLAVLGASCLTVLEPDPPRAQANLPCDIGISPGAAVTGAVGIGNPVGDVCDAVIDPIVGAAEDAALDPLKDAAKSIGQGVFNEITSWATDGATWLLGEIVALTEKTTTPDLLSAGFLRQYKQMASIAVVLAVAMLIFAALEGLGRGDPGMLWRVFLVQAPVAGLATSAAYVVVQLLVATTDGFCEAITHSTGHDTREFFKSAVDALGSAGGDAGATAGQASGTGATAGAATGTVAVPLFVGFIAAIVAAFAAFLVWIELLMRAAAIYAVALFMPLAIAASIWPRWMGALRKTGELVVVVVFSKFVIVAIIALAASLLAKTGGDIEHVLTAGALLLLACFAPVVLFRLVPFAEGAVGAAFSRQSAGGAALRTVQPGSSVQMLRRTAQANWRGGGGGAGAGRGRSGPSSASSGSGTGGVGSRTTGGLGGDGVAAAGRATGAATLPLAAGVGAAKSARAGADRLVQKGTAQRAGQGRVDQQVGIAHDVGAQLGVEPRVPRFGKVAPTGSTSQAATAGGKSAERLSAPKSAVRKREPTKPEGGAAAAAKSAPPRPSSEVGKPTAR